jgi:hypothetical protein
MPQSTDIKYLNKDFGTFKSDLIAYAKAYYPNSYNDFTQASPGSMFIEMASYVGDVLSFYLDNQLQETFLQYAKQKNNLYTMAYMLGYRPKVVGAAIVDLDVYQVVRATTIGGEAVPDFSYAFTINPGMMVTSNTNTGVSFYTPDKIDFTFSSSLDPTDVSVYQVAGNSPVSFLLKKKTQAVSGKLKTKDYPLGTAQRFLTLEINEPDIVSVVSITDSDGNTWYEVPYLAQDYINTPVANTAVNDAAMAQYANQVPYLLEKTKVDRRFTTRFKSNESLVIEFGPGINSVSDTSIIPNPADVGVGNTPGYTTIFTAWDPTNFVTTKTYGLAPYNTTLTVKYLVGGGSEYNVLSNQLTNPSNVQLSGVDFTFASSVATNNPSPASGGGDGDTIEELRQNSLASYMSQDRAVTQMDYLQKSLSMPAKYGKVSKAYITKDDSTFQNYYAGQIYNKDQILVSLYVLGLDSNGNLGLPSPALLKNLDTYISDYRMLTDAVNIKPAYIINIGCNFDVVMRPNYNGQDVLARCLKELKSFFSTSNWQINEPIVLTDVFTLLDKVDGVQTVKRVDIINKSGGQYSPYSYDITAATLDNVVYPSLDPSIFEIKFPDSDILGRVVTF